MKEIDLREAQHPPIEVTSSLMNFVDRSTFYTLAWTVGKFVDTASQAGYEGLEWHPLRLLPSFQIRQGLLTEWSKQGIRSAHQSWRSERSFREAWVHPNRNLAVISYLILHERVASLDNLERLQKAVGRELPVVLYPPHGAEESGTERRFAEKTFQLTPEVMKRWGVQTFEELTREMYRRGYTGYCLDLFHFRGKGPNGIDLTPWQDALPQILPHTTEIHVSAGRIDVHREGIDSFSELTDLIEGTRTTELSKVLEGIKEFGWQGRVVTEIPASALHLRRFQEGCQSKILTPRVLAEDHRKIVETVSGLLT